MICISIQTHLTGKHYYETLKWGFLCMWRSNLFISTSNRWHFEIFFPDKGFDISCIVFWQFVFDIISSGDNLQEKNKSLFLERMRWSGGAKVLCILHHWGVQLILAYSWARPAILVVGKGRGGNVFISSVSSLSFLFLFLPCPSLSSPLLSLLSLFSLSLGDDTKWPSRVDVSLNPNTINQFWKEYEKCFILFRISIYQSQS